MPTHRKKSTPPGKTAPPDRPVTRVALVAELNEELAEIRSDDDPHGSSYSQKLWRHFEEVAGRLEVAESELPGLRAEVSRLQQENQTLRAAPDNVEIASLRSRAETAELNVQRMENLMGVSGLSRENVVQSATAPYGSVADQYTALKKQEAAGEITRGTASKFYAKHKNEIAGD